MISTCRPLLAALLFIAIMATSSCSSFQIGSSTSGLSSSARTTRLSLLPTATTASARRSSALYESNKEASEEDESKEEPPPPPKWEPPAALDEPSTPQKKPLDPLFVAVTRMDEETAKADSVQIPLWGDLILDKSLFVLLPLAAFGIGGVLLSLFVLFNSGDQFVGALQENAILQSTPPPASMQNAGDSGCRGLCSSQEQDLEGLREYMSKFAK